MRQVQIIKDTSGHGIPIGTIRTLWRWSSQFEVNVTDHKKTLETGQRVIISLRPGEVKEIDVERSDRYCACCKREIEKGSFRDVCYECYDMGLSSFRNTKENICHVFHGYCIDNEEAMEIRYSALEEIAEQDRIESMRRQREIDKRVVDFACDRDMYSRQRSLSIEGNIAAGLYKTYFADSK